MVTRTPRLLLKTKPVTPGTGFTIEKLPFRLEPLFPDRHRAASLGMGKNSEWHVATIPEASQEADSWDLCHRLVSRGFGFAGAPAIEFAEPDLEQQWTYETTDTAAAKGYRATSAKDSCDKPGPPNTGFPSPTPFDWRWFQDPDHSGLANARSAVGEPKNPITIAHLDTGYRKGHSVLPPHLDYGSQRSFVENDTNPNDASDPYNDGFPNNPGHGTGTLSILAGGLFNGSPFGSPKDLVGGAPFARVIPIRVANSVVLFTNSSIAQGLEYAISNNVDVLSMSMGGIPSQVWADMVNEAYEAGITLVTAAGNNYGPFKFRVPRFIVYPARFRRVIAACGVMSNGKPYADFADPRKMGGSYGPGSKMDTALAAYTPNTVWAKYACTGIVDFDGAGTSAATPQIAAAAACWIQAHSTDLKKLPKAWMRVEAVRKALFDTANNSNREHFGRGTLRAHLAMDQDCAQSAALTQLPQDSIGIPILDPILGVIFGAAKPTISQQMLHLEAAQIFSRSGEIQNMLGEAGVDPDNPGPDVSDAFRAQLVEALLDNSTTSKALREVLSAKIRSQRPTLPTPSSTNVVPGEIPNIPTPLVRKLRVFAFDPILGLRLDTESLNQTTLKVPWETNLEPGPIGEYLEVIDVDPSSNVAYAPIDLNHPSILASDGLDPSEGVPQFHQQMVYAVAMTTIGRFEQALGRRALWAPQLTRNSVNGQFQHSYVQRLRIYPHALREANAYYSPPKKSLLFGYFQANTDNAGDNLPGGLIFNCLSHDVVAHETTHALLDGVHRYYQYQTNLDVAAFHEAFADLVALFQHFTIPAALKHTIARTRGDLRNNNLLADLAQQFGQASNGSRALRSALGTTPTPTDYASATEAHDRGAVLLAAVFQAFLEMYEARTSDLKRLATGGTGVLPPGDISVDLTNRLANEASLTASHVLTTCIRALDYCPPVDLTFGDFLRALVTADLDVEPFDGINSRTAFISGFRARGIFPSGVRNVSEENLRWQPPTFNFNPEQFHQMINSLDLTWNLTTDRKRAYQVSRSNGAKLWIWLKHHLTQAEAKLLGADLGVYLKKDDDVPRGIPSSDDGNPIAQIHSVRPARRIGSRGQELTDLVIEAVQRIVVTDPDTGEQTTHRGGCTLLIDLQNERIRYAIRKRVNNESRIEAERNFMRMVTDNGQPYFAPNADREPFAMLHRSL